MSKWDEVTATLDSWVVEAFENGDLPGDDIDRWIHETADGCEFVIWNSEVMEIWNSSQEVQDFEPMDGHLGIEQSIISRMTLTVFLAIEDHLRQAIKDHQEELDERE